MEERLTFLLESELKRKIEEVAKDFGMNSSAWVRMVIIKELKKTEREEI